MRLFGTLLLLLLFVVPLPGYASVAPIKGTIERGVKLCGSGAYAKGVETILDGAMELRRVAPRHPLNRQWRFKLDRCFRQWIATHAKSCRVRGRVDSYKTLQTIKGRAALMASKGIRRAVDREIGRCFRHLKSRYKKGCTTNPKVVFELGKLMGAVSKEPKLLKELKEVMSGCLAFQWKGTMERCQREFSIATLRALFQLKKMLPKSRQITQEYAGCLVTQLRGGRNLCRKMSYTRGRTLAKKAYYLLKHVKGVESTTLHQARSDLRECGTHTLDLRVTMTARSGGVPYTIRALSRLVVSDTKDHKGIRACGKLRFQPTKVTKGRCSTLATIGEKRGGHWICFRGKRHKTPRGSPGAAPTLELTFDDSMARTLVRETVQFSCPKRNPTLFKEKLFENLLTGKRLSIRIRAVGAEKRSFRIPIDAGNKRSAVFTGSFTLHLF